MENKSNPASADRHTDTQTEGRPQPIDPEQHQQRSRGCTRLFPLPPRQRGDHGSLIKQAKGYFMSSVQLVRSNPPPWPKSPLFVRKLLNEAVLDANYLPTLRQLGFFFLFFVFFWALQKQIFPSKFSRKHSPRCENLPPKCCFTPTPLLLPE